MVTHIYKNTMMEEPFSNVSMEDMRKVVLLLKVRKGIKNRNKYAFSRACHVTYQTLMDLTSTYPERFVADYRVSAERIIRAGKKQEWYD